jgi:hypothetical protein
MILAFHARLIRSRIRAFSKADTVHALEATDGLHRSMKCLNSTSIPLSALTIFALDDLPEKWQAYTETNKNYVDGGKFQPDKYQKASS